MVGSNGPARSWQQVTALQVHEAILRGDRVESSMGTVLDSRLIVSAGSQSEVMLNCGENGWSGYACSWPITAFM